MRSLFAVLLALAVPSLAAADEAPAISPNVGMIDVIAQPGGEHIGRYGYVAASTLIPAGKVAIIPAVGVEWAPAQGFWGFTGVVTADYALGSHIGVDLNVAFIHDQLDHRWESAVFLAGGGPGISIFVGKTTISPYVSWFQGLNVDGDALVPGINVSFPL